MFLIDNENNSIKHILNERKKAMCSSGQNYPD